MGHLGDDCVLTVGRLCDASDEVIWDVPLGVSSPPPSHGKERCTQGVASYLGRARRIR